MTGQLRRYRELVDAGASREQIRSALRRGDLERVTRGVYAPDGIEPDRLRAVMLRLPERTVVGYHSGARLHGFGVLPHRGIHVIVPAGTPKPRIAGVVAHEAVLPVTERVFLAGVPCAPAARCAVDLARAVRRMDALPLLDAALRARACTPDELTGEALRHGKLRGVCQVRQLVAIADGRAECRQESQLRLVLIDAGLPAPEPQVWVIDEYGVPVYRLDLAYRRRRVGLEYDGASHLDRDRLRHDRVRLNWLAAHGWTMRFFTDADLYRRPHGIVNTVRATLL